MVRLGLGLGGVGQEIVRLHLLESDRAMGIRKMGLGTVICRSAVLAEHLHLRRGCLLLEQIGILTGLRRVDFRALTIEILLFSLCCWHLLLSRH